MVLFILTVYTPSLIIGN